MRLGDMVTVKINDPDADFWVVRRGTPDAVGKPVRTFSSENYGITVTATDRLDPNFLFYIFQYAVGQGYFQARAKGSIRLVNIRKADIEDMEFS